MEPTPASPSAGSRIRTFLVTPVFGGIPAWVMLAVILGIAIIVTIIIAALSASEQDAPAVGRRPRTLPPAGTDPDPENPADYGVDPVYEAAVMGLYPESFPPQPEYHDLDVRGNLTEAAVAARMAYIRANPHLFPDIRGNLDAWRRFTRRSGGGIRPEIARMLAICDSPACAAWIRDAFPDLTGDEWQAASDRIEQLGGDVFRRYSDYREPWVEPGTGLPILPDGSVPYYPGGGTAPYNPPVDPNAPREFY